MVTAHFIILSWAKLLIKSMAHALMMSHLEINATFLRININYLEANTLETSLFL